MKEHLQHTSPVGSHIMQCQECSDSNINDLFTVLKHVTSRGNRSLYAMEAIFIDKHKPILNKQLLNKFNDFHLIYI